MTVPLQLDLLNDSTSRLFGLRVKLPDGCRRCGNAIAIIGRGSGPHFGELKCEAAGHHCGWLSKSTSDWITTIISKFGCPDTPIRLRRR
jgi:hypothetical protein